MMKKNKIALLICTISLSSFSNGYAFEESLFIPQRGSKHNKLSASFEHLFSDQQSPSSIEKTTLSGNATFEVHAKEKQSHLILTKAKHHSLSQALQLPSSSVTIPKQLWDAKLNYVFKAQLEDKKSFSLLTSIHSPSDAPFSSLDVTQFQTIGIYQLPQSQTESLWLFIEYSTKRSFLPHIPLPGVGYSLLFLDQKAFAFLGIPFAFISYRPDAHWSVKFFTLFPTLYRFEVANRFYGPFQAYISSAIETESYFLKDHSKNKDRLYFSKKNILIGLRAPLSQSLSVDVNGGYTFDQKYFEDHSSFLSKSSKLYLASQWGATFNLDYRF